MANVTGWSMYNVLGMERYRIQLPLWITLGLTCNCCMIRLNVVIFNADDYQN
jgi:hypothetical protein